MSDDTTTPATRQDLKDLEVRLTTDLTRFFKSDLHDLENRIDTKITASENRLISDLMRHFDLTVETIRHDVLGANRDEIEVIKDRVTRLEKHTGLVAH